jgi:hypothetical protein
LIVKRVFFSLLCDKIGISCVEIFSSWMSVVNLSRDESYVRKSMCWTLLDRTTILRTLRIVLCQKSFLRKFLFIFCGWFWKSSNNIINLNSIVTRISKNEEKKLNFLCKVSVIANRLICDRQKKNRFVSAN